MKLIEGCFLFCGFFFIRLTNGSKYSSILSTFPFSSHFPLPSPFSTYAVVSHHSNSYLPGTRRGSRKREKWKKFRDSAEEREDMWKEEINPKQKKIDISSLRFGRTNNENNEYYNDNSRKKKSDNNLQVRLPEKTADSTVRSGGVDNLFFSAANSRNCSPFFSNFFNPLSSVFTSSSPFLYYFSTFIFPFPFCSSSFSLSSSLCGGGGGGGGGVSGRSSSSTILFSRPKSRSRRLLRRSTELGCPPRFRYVRAIERHFGKTANFSSLPPPSDPDYCPPVSSTSPLYSKSLPGLPPSDDPVEKDEFLPVIYSAVRAADLHKAEEIVVQRLKYCTLLTDFALTLHARSLPQLRAIAHAIEIALLKEQRIKLRAQDGVSSSGWIALDFGRLMVHVMTSVNRAKYKLEEVHSLAENVNISHILRKNQPEEFHDMPPLSYSPFYSSSENKERKSKNRNSSETENVLVSSSFSQPLPEFLMWKGNSEEEGEEVDPFWS